MIRYNVLDSSQSKLLTIEADDLLNDGEVVKFVDRQQSIIAVVNLKAGWSIVKEISPDGGTADTLA
jgi:hypothetical protein